MTLQPNETANSLMFALRLTEVSRWGIVAMGRSQSVGEHSYRVTMIAQAMYDYMEDGMPHNRDERIQVGNFAMVHDIFEVLSGDLDSVFKTAAKSLFGDALDQITWMMASGRNDTAQLRTELASIQRAANGTIVEALVKLSDLIEAVIYLNDYGTHQKHKEQVRDHILARLWSYVETYSQAYALKKYNWGRIKLFINKVLDHPGLESQGQRLAEAMGSGLHPNDVAE